MSQTRALSTARPRPGGFALRGAMLLALAAPAVEARAQVVSATAMNGPMLVAPPSPGVGGPGAPGVIFETPGTALIGESFPAGPVDGVPVGAESIQLLPPEVQVVRFHGPEGLVIEVLGPTPPPVPVPVGDGGGLANFALQVGVAYQLRISNIPNRPEAELFPMIQLVGHLHRPPGIDPGKYPIRVQFDDQDIDDVLLRGRLVTHVVYLEDPDQALPLSLPKQQIPVVSLGPAEDPMRVGAALGRPMAIVRLGNRTPMPSDLSGAPVVPLGAAPCPFTAPGAGRCGLPCGPVRGTPPPDGRLWAPADEFLCDGGDHGRAATFGGDGGLRGIDPRDAVIQFSDTRRPRVLPTNTVCVYAPRFAAVRTALGANQNMTVDILAGHEVAVRQEMQAVRQGPLRMNQTLAPSGLRHRERPSEMARQEFAAGYAEVRVLAGLDTLQHLGGHVKIQGPELRATREKLALNELKIGPRAIKTAESAVVTGVVEGANEQVMAWKPQETVGVEEPPNRPGMAVIKQVDASEAEPGDVLTFTIRFRNMGNVPISAVSVVDSLLPRLEYIGGSAQGPRGSVFTAAPNEVGSTELRWDLPGALEPGAEGYVTFQARVL